MIRLSRGIAFFLLLAVTVPARAQAPTPQVPLIPPAGSSPAQIRAPAASSTATVTATRPPMTPMRHDSYGMHRYQARLAMRHRDRRTSGWHRRYGIGGSERFAERLNVEELKRVVPTPRSASSAPPPH